MHRAFLWKAGLWEWRLPSIEHLWNFHSSPQEARVREQIWLCFCCAVLSKPVKSWGSFHLISRSIGSGLFCMRIFLFWNIPAGKQYKLIVFDEFSPGTRPISNGLNVRRVLRVSIIIKKLFFFFFFMYFKALVNLQMFREVSWCVNARRHFHAAGRGADLPQILVHCWRWTPQSWPSYRGLVTCHSHSTRFCSFLTLKHGCGVSGCFHLTDFTCVFVFYAQHYTFSNYKGKKRNKRGVSNKLHCAKYSTNIVTADAWYLVFSHVKNHLVNDGV